MISLIITVLMTLAAYGRPVTVAVIDTGINPAYQSKYKLCRTGHKDFTGTGLSDNHGHGTNIAGLIDLYAAGDYCIVILKYYDPKNVGSNVHQFEAALSYAVNNNYDIINISGGGNNVSNNEIRIMRKAHKNKITIIAAAGNNGDNLDTNCSYYPACHKLDNVVVVGNGTTSGPAPTSNYGKVVDFWENGENRTAGGVTLSGTSQSAAIVSGKFVNIVTKLIKQKKEK